MFLIFFIRFISIIKLSETLSTFLIASRWIRKPYTCRENKFPRKTFKWKVLEEKLTGKSLFDVCVGVKWNYVLRYAEK